jgi:tRNA splicing endonuclease
MAKEITKNKEAYYFSHDSNARNDEKIISLRIKHGMEGYGIYWAILERMRENSDYMCAKDYNLLAFDLHCKSETIESVVKDFELFSFTENENKFYSESFLRRMERKDEKSIKARESANARWKNKNKVTTENANAMRTHIDSNAIKEKKRKEIKEKEIKEKEIFISLNDLEDLIKNEFSWKETMVRNFKELVPNFNMGLLEEYLEQFFKTLENDGETEKTIKDLKKHFNRWLTIKINYSSQNNKKHDKGNNQEGNGTIGRTGGETVSDTEDPENWKHPGNGIFQKNR